MRMQSTSCVLFADYSDQFLLKNLRSCSISPARTRYGPAGTAAGCHNTQSKCKCFADLSTSAAVEQATTDKVADQGAQTSTIPRFSPFPNVPQDHLPHQLLPIPVHWTNNTQLETFKSPHRRIFRTLKALLRVSSRRVSYDTLTRVLAAASVLPALVLAVQPLVAINGSTKVSAAAAAELMSLEWQGPLRDMFSFTVLLSVFITCEPGAAASAAVCATGGALALLTGPAAPPPPAVVAASLLAAAAIVILLSAAASMWRLNVSSSSSSNNSNNCQLAPVGQALATVVRALGRCLPPALQPGDVMMYVQQALGVLGGGLLLQFLACSWSSSLVLPAAAPPEAAWLSQVSVGGAAVLLAVHLTAHHRSNNKQLQQLCGDWPAWSATLLLILQPLQQLVCSALEPSHGLPGISAWQQLLQVFASGLMVPRALMLGELMWFTGTGSGAMLAAGQLAVLAAHRATGGDTAVCVLVLVGVLVAVLQLLRAGWRKIAQV